MGTLLLNARTVRQLPTSSPKISKHFACYLLASMIRRAKRALSNQPAPIKLVSKMLTKCLLIEQGEYYEHERMFLLAVCQVSGGQVPTLVAYAHLSWRASLGLLKASGAEGGSMPCVPVDPAPSAS